MSARIPLLIDTDPGVDDALALLMAFDDPAHEVVGLTVAAGNVGLAHTVANALKLCEVCGVDVPVFAGAASPLLHPAADAAFVHGRDGFGDTGYAPATRRPQAEHAANAIVRLAREHEGRLLLVCLGPLTNLALALRLDPGLPSRIARCVVMGGAVTAHGNMSPAAEFNVGFDPEAAHIVFEAFACIDLCDWEATTRHGLLDADVERWLGADSPRARFFGDISRQTRAWSADLRGDRWLCADGLAMAFALEPASALETAGVPLAVELVGTRSRGASVVDWEGRWGWRDNVRILQGYRQDRFEGRIARALAAA